MQALFRKIRNLKSNILNKEVRARGNFLGHELFIRTSKSKQNKFGDLGNCAYLALGYLKRGIWAQEAENKPLPSRYLFSYIKAVTTR